MWRRQNSHPFDDDWWNQGPRELFDQDFGNHFNTLQSINRRFPQVATEFPPAAANFRMMGPQPPPYWMMPNRTQGQANESGASRVEVDDSQFTVNLDVRHFKPEEIKVSVVDEVVVVEGKHDEQVDEHGSIMRHFVRKYRLPGDVDAHAVGSSLTADGMLSISAPKLKPVEDVKKERTIPIKLVSESASVSSNSSTTGGTAGVTSAAGSSGPSTATINIGGAGGGTQPQPQQQQQQPKVINHTIKIQQQPPAAQ